MMAHASQGGASRSRPWTRVGAASIGAHVFYELACGVAMPFSSIRGPAVAAAGWLAGTTASYTVASRAPRTYDPAMGMMNGLFLSAVVAHFIYWPTRRTVGVPWLTECEGLRGPVMVPYNAILYTSGVAAIAGLVETAEADGGVRRFHSWSSLYYSSSKTLSSIDLSVKRDTDLPGGIGDCGGHRRSC